MDRYEKLKKQEAFRGMEGFAEAILEYEKNNNINFGMMFKFSRKDYFAFGRKMWLGKINQVYFFGLEDQDKGNKFLFFDNKKMIQYYFQKEFQQLEENILKEQPQSDDTKEYLKTLKEHRLYWFKELETLPS